MLLKTLEIISIIYDFEFYPLHSPIYSNASHKKENGTSCSCLKGASFIGSY